MSSIAPTEREVTAALAIVRAVGEAICDLDAARRGRGIPSGEFYARVSGMLQLEDYLAILETLKKARLIKVDGNHLVKWTGPAKGATQ